MITIVRLLATSIIFVLFAMIFITSCATIDCTADKFEMVNGMYHIKPGSCK